MSSQVESLWSVPAAGLARSLGDVLGDVCGYGVVSGPVAVGVQGAYVDLGTPAEGEFADCGAVGSADEDPLRGGPDGVGDVVGGAPGRRFVAGSGGAVEADDGVHVDGCPHLVLGDAGEGQSGVVGEAGLYEAR